MKKPGRHFGILQIAMPNKHIPEPNISSEPNGVSNAIVGKWSLGQINVVKLSSMIIF